MAEVTVPLGTAAVRSLIGNLKELSRELRDDVKVDVERAAANQVAYEPGGVVDNILGIQDVDGNYMGSDDALTAVSIVPWLGGHAALWKGKQIAYLEWGTGAKGAAGAIDAESMTVANYHPDPTKATWWFKDAKSGESIRSYGLTPQYVMYGAALEARIRGFKGVAAPIIGRALQRAVTLR